MTAFLERAMVIQLIEFYTQEYFLVWNVSPRGLIAIYHNRICESPIYSSLFTELHRLFAMVRMHPCHISQAIFPRHVSTFSSHRHLDL